MRRIVFSAEHIVLLAYRIGCILPSSFFYESTAPTASADPSVPTVRGFPNSGIVSTGRVTKHDLRFANNGMVSFFQMNLDFGDVIACKGGEMDANNLINLL